MCKAGQTSVTGLGAERHRVSAEARVPQNPRRKLSASPGSPRSDVGSLHILGSPYG